METQLTRLVVRFLRRAGKTIRPDDKKRVEPAPKVSPYVLVHDAVRVFNYIHTVYLFRPYPLKATLNMWCGYTSREKVVANCSHSVFLFRPARSV